MSDPVAAMLGLLVLVNTALTILVLRRLGSVQVAPTGWPGPSTASDAPPMTVRPGERIGDFTVTAVDGSTVGRADLVGSTLVAFLAPGCQACDFAVPGFVELAERAGRDHVVVVLMGTPKAGVELRERLAPIARVLSEEEAGPLVSAFGVIGLPAFALLDEGRMVSAAITPEDLPDAVPA